MARCDFSNARLEAIGANPITNRSRLGLENSDQLFKIQNGSFVSITTNQSRTAVTVKSTILKYIFNGTFTESGNSFYFGIAGNYSVQTNGYWKMSNISFNAGDTYSFEIDATYTFN